MITSIRKNGGSSYNCLSPNCLVDTLNNQFVLSSSFSNWKDRIVAKCLENHIAVYSPHTAWDAIEGGINDWLCSVVTGKDVNCITCPITPKSLTTGAGRIIELNETKDLQSIIETIKKESNLKTVQIAIGVNQNINSEIKRIALCAGSGGSVLKGVSADLYVTG